MECHTIKLNIYCKVNGIGPDPNIDPNMTPIHDPNTAQTGPNRARGYCAHRHRDCLGPSP